MIEKRRDPEVLIPELDCANAPLDGRTLIEAAAGTGKTFAITRLYLRLLLEQELPAGGILVVTFTEAATRELKERILATIKIASQLAAGAETPGDDFFRRVFARLDRQRIRFLLARALHSFDSAAIFTIHGFCRQVLYEHAFESGTLFTADICADQRELIHQAAADFWRRTFYGAPTRFIAFVNPQGCSGPSFFRELYGLRKGGDAQRLIPATAADPDTGALEAQLDARINEAGAQWRAHRGEIAALLVSCSLKQTSYSPEQIGRMERRMEALLDERCNDPSCLDDLKKWTPEALRVATRKNAMPPQHPFFDSCERLRDTLAALHGEYRRKFLALQIRFLDNASGMLAKEKERRSLLGFDDLLLRVRQSLYSEAGGQSLRETLGAMYVAALIDEFQDTDSVQYDIFDAIFPTGATLFLIGDPKQAIYRFRGADIFTYLRASRSAARRFTLSTSYRSDPRLLNAVNALFCAHDNPFAFEQVRYRRVRAGIRDNAATLVIDGERPRPFRLQLLERDDPSSLRACSREQATGRILDALCSEVGELIRAGQKKRATIADRPIAPSDIAVLVRTNTEAAAVRDALSSASIPAVLYLSGSVFGSFEAFELEVLLAAVAQPERRDLFAAALGTSFFGLSAIDIDRLGSDDREWNRFLARLIACHECWRANGVLCMLRMLMNEGAVRQRLLPHNGGERRLTNLLHLGELLHREALRSRLGMTAMVKWLAGRRADWQDATPPDDELLRLESDEEAVRIVTIHKSKGLEYPIVFCPFNWHPSEIRLGTQKTKPFLVHDPADDFAPSLAVSPEAMETFRPLAEEEVLAENMRLLYVALTRAKAYCACIWSPATGSETSALSWLLFGRELVKASRENGCAAGLPALRATVSALNDRQIHDILASRFEAVSSCLAIIRLSGDRPSPRPLLPREVQAGTALPRTFRSTIPAPRRILSYSAIAHAATFFESDSTAHRDGPFSAAPVAGAAADPAMAESFFAFPRGAKAGVFLHELFETIDFQNTSATDIEATAAAKLAQYGFAPEWKGVLAAMVQTTLATPLDPLPGLRLANIEASHRRREMEFCFPISSFSRQRLFEYIGETDTASQITDDHEYGDLGLKNSGGHLKGFIDLVFEWQDHFFIIDWKSNFLGNRPSDYSPDSIANAMVREHYLLQYHLYIAALHRYLAIRKPGYSYENHFGGVFYLFLRGVSLASGQGTGIFFAKPAAGTIERLETILHAERSN